MYQRGLWIQHFQLKIVRQIIVIGLECKAIMILNRVNYKNCKKTNWKVGWNQFADNLRARYAMGTKFPDALNLADYQLILNVKDQLQCYVYQRHQNEDELTRYQKMAIGPFLQDLKDYINNKTVFKIVSGHDVVIAALAGVLVEEWVCAQPDYASFMAFEIYGDTLKIRYRHSGEDEGVYVKQKACMQTECQVSDVIKFFEKYIITMQERMELCDSAF
ncbi:Acid_phosphatase [Hexamita inflata]|uniref:Acid_phosphatase n=1 Tax=Hexamita inflata TaxID=28002 RepID=A0ABP1KHL0_9EUKA